MAIIVSRGFARHPLVPSIRRLARLFAALLLVGTTACSAIGGSSGSGNRIVTPAPARSAATGPGSSSGGAAPPAGAAAATPNAAAPSPAGSVRLRGQQLSAADLYVAYRAILDDYVDQVDSKQLVSVATSSLRQSLQGQVSLPLLTMPVALIPPPSGDADKDWQAFGDAYDSVVGKLPDWAEQAHPDWAVLRSMADSLKDRNTSFLTPDEAQRARETSFAGIGVLLSRPQEDQPPFIAEIFPNSPAASSTLKRGDQVVAVNGQATTGKTVAEIAQLIRGDAGTSVTLTVARLSSAAPIDVQLKRAQVQVDQVFGRQLPGAPIGYLRIRSFQDTATLQQILGILDEGRQRGLKAWVIDLRGNPGGSLPAVVAAAGAFLDQDHTTIGYQVDRQKQQTPLQTQSLGLTQGMTVVVLVDHDSASGTEILSAALQEAHAATLVGSKTAGNVSVAGQITLGDDSVLQLTEERFVSPSGAQLDGVGVTPDVQVDMTDEDLQKDQDPQLARALQMVVQKLTSS